MSFSFGAPRAQAPAAGGFSFGASPAPAASLSFGGAAAPAAAAPATTGFSFGAAPAANPAPSFGAATSAFGTTPATTGFGAAPATTGFGGFKPAGTAAPTASLSFGAPAAAAPAQPLFGAPAASTQAQQPQGLFNLSTAAAPSFGAAATTAPAPVLGLGGVDINASQPKTVEGGKHDGTKAREAQLPQEIATTLETLKAHIKQQKTLSSDIARTSQRRLNYVATETQTVQSTLAELSDAVEANCSSVKALRAETGHVIQQAEMAQRTHETPAGLQFENTAPLMYFAGLVGKFEHELIAFKNQVELTEKHMRSLSNPQSFTGQDLKHGLQQIHECFIALAGRHHEIHQRVEAQKGLYLKLRKYFLNDRTDVFAEQDEKRRSDGGGSGGGGVGMGPTPFSNLLLTLPQSPQSQTTGNTTGGQVGGQATGFGTSAAPVNSFSFGNPQQTLTTTAGAAFDLQKPPLGGKRNKAFF